MSSQVVLDSSALLAIAKSEAGADTALSYFPDVAMSSVNVCEVVSKLLQKGDNSEDIERDIAEMTIEIVPFDWTLAMMAAKLIGKTAASGLSLGDRACLATGQALGVPVITADRIWATLDIGVEVRLIR